MAANNVALSAIINPSFGDIVYGNHNGGNSWAPTISSAPNSQLQSYSLDGEFLSWARPLQQTPETVYDLPGDPNLTTFLPDNLDLHSMASLIIHMYAETEIPTQTDWHAASPYFWPVLYDNIFALSIGADDAELLRAKLAYSAIDAGTLIFGDTGIHALYDDANDFGKALSNARSSNAIETYATDITKVFVQFSGLLALNELEESNSYITLTQNVTDGALNFYTAPNDIASGSFEVSFADKLWSAAGKGTLPDIIVRDDMVDALWVTVVMKLAFVCWHKMFGAMAQMTSFFVWFLHLKVLVSLK